MYAQVINGEITRINISLPFSTENASIPAGATDVEQFGLYPMVGNEPAYDPTTQRLSGPVYTFNGKEVERVYTVEAIPQEELRNRLATEVVASTQKRLDDFAKTRNYDGILSLCTYATSLNAKFKAEGQYGVEARDATWAKLYDMLAEVEFGTRPKPNGYSDVEPELPVLAWP